MKIFSWYSKLIKLFQNGKQTKCSSRLDVLQRLNSSCVLFVHDFAMKFLPSRYREA